MACHYVSKIVAEESLSPFVAVELNLPPIAWHTNCKGYNLYKHFVLQYHLMMMMMMMMMMTMMMMMMKMMMMTAMMMTMITKTKMLFDYSSLWFGTWYTSLFHSWRRIQRNPRCLVHSISWVLPGRGGGETVDLINYSHHFYGFHQQFVGKIRRSWVQLRRCSTETHDIIPECP